MGGIQSREYVQQAYSQAREAKAGKSLDGRVGEVTTSNRQSAISKELDELGGEVCIIGRR